MENITKSEDLQKWYKGFIDYFREEYEKLSPDEKQAISNTNNFLNPCQIEIFWIKDSSFQLIVQSNFSDRPDKEIFINGPFDSHEFKQRCVEILKEDRWKRKLEDKDLPSFFEKHDVLGELMALHLHHFIETYKNYLTFSIKQTGDYGGSAVEDTWARNYIGNIADLDYVQEVNKVIDGLKKEAKRRKEEKLPTTSKPAKVVDQYTGYGVHLFPPIIIGKKRKRTIDELINDYFPSWEMRGKSFDTKIANRQVIVNNDGFLFIESENKSHALKIFNLIMALGIFHDVPLFAVRDHELSQVNYDKTTNITTGMRWNPESRRAFLFEESWNPKNVSHIEKKEIEPAKLREIFDDTQKLYKYGKLSEDLRLFNEAHTHLQNSEFAQSFIMSWAVIERHYSDLWRSMLHDTNVDDERFSKLTNSAVWSIDFILEALTVQNEIDEASYDLLMELKKKRNKFYHSGKQVTNDDAERCMKYAYQILTQKITPITKLNSVN